MAPHCFAHVILPERTAFLQDWNDRPDELLERTGHHGRRDDEAVGAFRAEYLLKLIRNLLRRSHDLRTQQADAVAAADVPERCVAAGLILRQDVKGALGATDPFISSRNRCRQGT
ncbi:MAG: hypothetical protein AB7S80_11670 [Rhizobiaceae bacterium]